MTPFDTATALKKPIGELGMQFMADPVTRESGKKLGLRGRPLYHLGRGGALGDVSADVVIAAFGFFPPEVVTEHWDAARKVLSPTEGARAYAGMCNDWGRRAFTDQPGVERADALLGAVLDEAEIAGLPLFAGWRMVVEPEDAPGRLAQRIHVMREHRGAVHVAAVAAVGLHPLAAIVAGTYGVGNAAFFEWPEPYPEPELHRAAWTAAEELTATAAAGPYAVLEPQERAELVDLLTALHTTVLG